MADEPIDTTRAFIHAVVWGEHHVVWDMLTAEARKEVLSIATGRGMPEPLAARLRNGTATEAELDQFRGDLVNGFRADLLGTEIDTLEYEVDESPLEAGSARVMLTVPVPNPMLGRGLPTASVELRHEDADGTWRVERMVRRLGK